MNQRKPKPAPAQSTRRETLRYRAGCHHLANHNGVCLECGAIVQEDPECTSN